MLLELAPPDRESPALAGSPDRAGVAASPARLNGKGGGYTEFGVTPAPFEPVGVVCGRCDASLLPNLKYAARVEENGSVLTPELTSSNGMMGMRAAEKGESWR